MRVIACLTALVVPMLAAQPGWDHRGWDALLKQDVNREHRVDYRALKADAAGRLDEHVARLAAPWPAGSGPAERKAALINAYNALTVLWVLRHYPQESIWRTKRPFTEKRHTVDGKRVSLDDVETELRQCGDPRMHAVLVCAARSCPPLRREAYVAERLEEQLDANTREWLAHPALNRFDAARRTAEVSRIFDWYAKDFTGTGGVQAFLARYAPAGSRFLGDGQPITLRHLTYHWGLNDASSVGESYSQWNFLWDKVGN